MPSRIVLSSLAFGLLWTGSPRPTRAEPVAPNAIHVGLRANADVEPSGVGELDASIAIDYERRLSRLAFLHVDGAFGRVLADETEGHALELSAGLGVRSTGRRFAGVRVDLVGLGRRYAVKGFPDQTVDVMGRLVAEVGRRLGPRRSLGVELGLGAGLRVARRSFDSVGRITGSLVLGVRFEQRW